MYSKTIISDKSVIEIDYELLNRILNTFEKLIP